ncbi:Uncharacterized protein dnm_034810 [Desulfonema magnum]|uniref:Uncharacterized protein n=1 Tax=Desulfonema magnum TaxID=45655 RepID=A0A975GN66_9BACT|nr:Uncharacterized protein dnm_034810 [Desulfonema magnum]
MKFIWDLGFVIRDLGFVIWDLLFGICYFRFTRLRYLSEISETSKQKGWLL